MGVIQKFFRRKLIDREETATELNRVLSTFDLTLLGIGSTLGLGIYVLAGSVAKTSAGPAVIVSFFVAAFASVLAGLCYAEFGARVPKAGSAYVYSYVCVGEIIAFIVGWNLIMEYVIGVASVAKGYSGYVDSLFPDHAMRKAFESVGVIDVEFLASYFDFFAFGMVVILTFLLMFGVKESSIVNNIFTILNLLVVLFTIIAGAIYSNTNNWIIDPLDPPQCTNLTDHEPVPMGKVGEGKFAPFGFAGIAAGAATCFYGFIGFDVIATTGEEAKNPKRAIPISIVLSLLFIFLAYSGISTVMTLMLPYYCQDENAPLPFAFQYQLFNTGKWIVNIGSLFGLSTSLLGSIFPMPRVIYSMARDGLLFGFFSYVHPKYQTPVWATLIGGLLGAIMGGLFKLDALIDMMSIGTLTAYTLVAMCVLMLRYRKDESGADDTGVDDSNEPITVGSYLGQIFNCKGSKIPTKLSSRYTTTTVVLYWIFCFGFCATAIMYGDLIEKLELKGLVPLIVFGVLMLFQLVSLCFQPTSRLQLTFKVPFLPFIPAFSMLINTYLILNLSYATWIRFTIWMIIGLLIYAYCLISGRADNKYREAGEEHKNKLRNVSKVSIHGIDNPALSLEDEKFGGETQSKYHDDRDEDTQKSSKDSFTKEKHVSESSPVNGILKNTLKDAIATEKLQMSALQSSPIDYSQAIHEINQNVMKELHQVVPLILSTEDEKLQTKSAIQAFIAENSNGRQEEKIESSKLPENEDEDLLTAINSTLTIHENVQNSFQASYDDRTEKQKAVDLVESIINEAVQNHDDCSKDAEILVNDILTLAQEQAIESSLEEDVPPPFVTRMNQLNDFQSKMADLIPPENTSENSATPVRDPVVENIIAQVHLSMQDSIKGRTATIKPLLASPEEKAENQALIANLLKNQDAPTKTDAESIPDFIPSVLPQQNQAQSTVEAANHLDQIDAVIQNQLNESVGSGDDKPILVSPEIKKETQEIIQEFVQSNLETIAPIVQVVASPSTTPDVQDIVENVEKIHEKVKELMEPESEPVPANLEDNLEQIHQICQKNLLNEPTKLAPILLTRSEKEDAKDFVRDLLKNSLQVVEQIQIENDTEKSVTPPPQISEQEIKEIHDKAQAVLLEKSDTTTAPGLETVPGDTPSPDEIQVHQVAQLSLHGVDSPVWLKPILSDEKDKSEIKELNKELIKEAKEASQINPTPETKTVDAEPMPPHVIRQSLVDLNNIHLVAQESLRTHEEPSTSKIPESVQLPESVDSERIPKVREEDDNNYTRVESLNGSISDRDDSEDLPSPPPTPTDLEPIYATVNKPKLSEVPPVSDSEKSTEKVLGPRHEEKEDDSAPKRVSDRRPTGPFLPQLEKLKLGESESLGELNEDEEAEHVEKEEEILGASSRPDSEASGPIDLDKPDGEGEVAVPRRQSTQNVVGDLLSVFEQVKSF